MRSPAILTAAIAGLLLGACSSAPVGYFDSNRVVRESAVCRALLEEPNRRLQVARDDSAQAQEALAHADELTAAARREAADKARAESDAAQRAQVEAGHQVDSLIAAAAAKLAIARRMTLVLPVGGKLPFAAPAADLTRPMIDCLDGGGDDLVRARAAAAAAMQTVRALEAAQSAPAKRP